MAELDVTLIKRAQTGDLEAYAAIVQQFQDMTIGYSYALLGDFHLAQDAAQEAFIRAYHDLPKLHEPAAFPSWLRRVIFKYCDRLTRGKHVRTLPLDRAAEVVDRDPEPSVTVESREMQNVLLKAVDTLPEHERIIMLLFYIGGYSQEEIGTFLELPIPTVKNRLHAARNRLRAHLLEQVKAQIAAQRLSRDDVFVERIVDTFRRRGLDMLARYQRSPTDDAAPLRQACNDLWQAFELGDYQAETVWSLTRVLHYSSDMDRLLEVLKTYADHAPTPDEAFSARQQIVCTYALLYRDTEAVALHRRLLQQMRGTVPDTQLLDSLSIPTIAWAWQRCSALAEWRSLADHLYARVDDLPKTCAPRVYYLRTLNETLYIPLEQWEQALATCDELATIIGKYRQHWAEARCVEIDVVGMRLQIYHQTAQHDLAHAILADGEQALHSYRRWLEERPAPGDDEQPSDTKTASAWRMYQAALHNFACYCLWCGPLRRRVAEGRVGA